MDTKMPLKIPLKKKPAKPIKTLLQDRANKKVQSIVDIAKEQLESCLTAFPPDIPKTVNVIVDLMIKVIEIHEKEKLSLVLELAAEKIKNEFNKGGGNLKHN